jgi:hypothetical protein
MLEPQSRRRYFLTFTLCLKAHINSRSAVTVHSSPPEASPQSTTNTSLVTGAFKPKAAGLLSVTLVVELLEPPTAIGNFVLVMAGMVVVVTPSMRWRMSRRIV